MVHQNTPPDRRTENAQLLKSLQAEYESLAKRVDTLQTNLQANTDTTKKIEADLKANTDSTKKLETNTAELVETFTALKGGLTVMGWLGKISEKLLWLGIPGAFLLYSWTAFKAWLIGGPRP